MNDSEQASWMIWDADLQSYSTRTHPKLNADERPIMEPDKEPSGALSSSRGGSCPRPLVGRTREDANQQESKLPAPFRSIFCGSVHFYN